MNEKNKDSNLPSSTQAAVVTEETNQEFRDLQHKKSLLEDELLKKFFISDQITYSSSENYRQSLTTAIKTEEGLHKQARKFIEALNQYRVISKDNKDPQIRSAADLINFDSLKKIAASEAENYQKLMEASNNPKEKANDILNVNLWNSAVKVINKASELV